MARAPVQRRVFAHPARPRNQNVGGARQQGYGFFPASGTDYTHGNEPEIARRLERLGETIKLHLVGLSGYRTPAHSVSVGGFANDPHTRGEASDTPGVEGVAETTLERFGLTRPFGGTAEADHIQLFGGKGKGKASGKTSTSTGSGPADWLKQGGWPKGLFTVMTAIGGAESGWKIDATHTNTDGSTDDGWLQVNSVHGFDRARLRSDPVYASAAAYKVYKEQGLAAWTTYTSGAYKRFLGVTPRTRSFGGSGSSGSSPRTRPTGGSGSDTPDGPDVTTVLSDWASARDGETTDGDGNQFASFGPGVIPSPLGFIPNPFSLSKGLSESIHDTKDFFKLLAWIINPINILRMVEFFAGLVFIAFGFQTMLKAYGEQRGLSSAGLGRVSRELSRAATTAVPEARVASAAKSPRKGSPGAGYTASPQKATKHKQAKQPKKRKKSTTTRERKAPARGKLNVGLE